MDTFSQEEWHKDLVKVDKVAVAFVDDPLVGALEILVGVISTVRADKAMTLADVLVALVVGHLQFELDVIADVGVLPPEELDTEGELTPAQLFMQQVFLVLRILPLIDLVGNLLSRNTGNIHALTYRSRLDWIKEGRLSFLVVLSRAGVTTVEFLKNLTVKERRSFQIDVALPSVLRVAEHLAIFLRLELSLDVFSGKFVLSLE